MVQRLEKIVKFGKTAFLAGLLALFSGCSDEDPVSAHTSSATPAPKKNNPPVFVSAPITTVNEKENYIYWVKASDADGDKMVYSLLKSPSWLSISSYNVISGIAPEVSSDEVNGIEVAVSDGRISTLQKYNLTVKNKTDGTSGTNDTSDIYLLSAGQLSGLTVNDNNLSFAQPVNFGVNDIIGSGITNSTPYGLLRKVVSVSSDKKIVYTEQATLEEAIKDGSFEYKGKISNSGAIFIPAKKGISLLKTAPSLFDFTLNVNNVVIYDFDNNPNTTDDRLIADGKISFSMDYELKGEVNKMSLDELLFKIIATEKCEIKIRSPDSFMGFVADIPLGSFSLPPFSIGNMPIIPYLPLTVYPKIEVNLKFFGGMKSLETKVSQEAVFTAGLSYNRGQWLPIWDFSNSFSFTPPALDPAPFSFYVKAGPEIKFPLYNFAGPNVNLLAKMDLESSLEKWSLYGGVESNAGVEMKVFKRVLADFSAPLFTYRELLAEGKFDQPKKLDTLIIQPGPEGKDAYVRKYIYPDGTYTSFGDGNASFLDVTNISPLTSSIREAYIEFPLSSIPSNANIFLAKLMLYGPGAYSGETAKVEVHKVLEPWYESNIEWDNKPAYSAFSVANSVLSDQIKWHEWDITSMVEEWVNSKAINYGLSLTSGASRPKGDDSNGFKSGDCTDSSKRPKVMVLYYTNP